MDLLAGDKESGKWTAQSADGRTWVNLSDPEGRSFAEKQAGETAGWGFGFIVLAPSAIPDEVLAQFGMTRAQADRLAFEAAVAGSKNLPVYPAAATTMTADRDLWLEAASDVCRMAVYDILVGPVRLDASSLEALPKETLLAMRLWPGPIEVTGTPKSAGKGGLAQVFQSSVLKAFPVDAARRSPLLWQVQAGETQNDMAGSSVLAFSGAPAWSVADLETAAGGAPMTLWQPAGGTLLGTDQPAPAAQQMTVTGVAPLADRPTFMGTSNVPSLDLDRLRDLKWNEAEGVLSGRIDGATESTAYVHVPSPWVLKSGKVGSASVKAKEGQNVLSFPVNGTGISFELTFRKS
jgi:hypothetical protein